MSFLEEFHMSLGLIVFSGVVLFGLWLFVPAAHTAILNAWTAGRDDLTKLETSAAALVKRLEGHAAAQAQAATDLSKAAAVASSNASVASTAASAAKSALSALSGK